LLLKLTRTIPNNIPENKKTISKLLLKIKKWPEYECTERISSGISKLEMEWAEEYGNELSPYEFADYKRPGFIIKFLPYHKEKGKSTFQRSV